METAHEGAKGKPSSGKPPSENPPAERPPEDRLDSWKEIAAYLNRDVTTVQRWEKREGMPIHRHLHERIGSVYASRSDLDEWVRSRNLHAPYENGTDSTSPDPTVPPLPPAKPHAQPGRRGILLLLAAAAVLMSGTALWLWKMEYFWRNPIANARFRTVTDFDGMQQAAAVSRDGHFVAFLSDRDGPVDVWVTQIGSGEFHNLTHGTVKGLFNPLIRALGFSPDGSQVTYWARRPDSSGAGDISVWGVPTLGGQPRLYLEGVAEYDWSHDGARLAYHTPGPGDPTFVSDGSQSPAARPIFTAPAGIHSHFPLWSRDNSFIYSVQGTLPNRLDIWRIPATGGTPERITSHNSQVTYPVLLDRRTLMYLASDPDGAGPWLYSMDVVHRIPHRLTSGLDRYTSLAATADGRRLVATLANPKTTLWRLYFADLSAKAPASPIPLTTGAGFSPRMGPGYLLYVSENGSGESIWKLTNGASSELWGGKEARFIGAPAISPDGRNIAFSVRRNGQTLLYAMQADGTNIRILSDSLDLQGAPAWAPDGRSITSAVADQGIPRLFRIPVDGRSPALFVKEYSVGPTWAPDGRFAVYSGPDIGTSFSVKAVTAEGAPHPIPALTLTRKAQHLAFLPGKNALLVLRGDIQHKDIWLIDLETGASAR